MEVFRDEGEGDMTFGRKEGDKWHIYRDAVEPNRYYDYQIVLKDPRKYEEETVYCIESNEIHLIRKRGEENYESPEE